MPQTPLSESLLATSDVKTSALLDQYRQLLRELNDRPMPDNISTSINAATEELNRTQLSGKPLQKLLKEQQTAVLKLLEKELKVVPKDHYRTQWMALGMSAFGIPLGVAFGLSIGNMGMLGVGLPIGLAIGLAVGSGLDKKALDEGRQLQVKLKY
jgi:hypothetical protein